MKKQMSYFTKGVERRAMEKTLPNTRTDMLFQQELYVGAVAGILNADSITNQVVIISHGLAPEGLMMLIPAPLSTLQTMPSRMHLC